jgi:hypothetical protein
MHKFIKSLSTREILSGQVPAIALSIVIAELFYKFHSFTLECLAFLLISLVFRYFSRNQTASMDPTTK